MITSNLSSHKQQLNVILCHCLSHYLIARYKALTKARNDFVIVEMAAKESAHSIENEKSNLPFRVITLYDGFLEDKNPSFYTKKIKRILDELQPVCVVSLSYYEPYMRTASIWAKKHHSASILIIDSWDGDKKRYMLKEFIKSLWCKKYYDGSFVSGIRAALYAQKLGVSPTRIWKGVDVVDNHHFLSLAQIARKNNIVLREKYSLPEKYFLTVSRLAIEKNLARLLVAYQRYLSLGGDWDLVIVGEGPCKDEIHALSRKISSTKVHLEEWKAYDELPIYYGLAGGFILASVSEPWGLVVNEAMASGLPILVSTKCGCLPELCWRGVNGFDFDPFDCDGMAKTMIKLSSLEEHVLYKMGEASKLIIQNYSPDVMASSFSDCIDSLCKYS
jgi:1,2-diacylglycerol 3-alpha-glucosyltransferase